MEEAKKVNRESDRKRGKTGLNRQAFTPWKAPCCVKVCFSVDMCRYLCVVEIQQILQQTAM